MANDPNLLLPPTKPPAGDMLDQGWRLAAALVVSVILHAALLLSAKGIMMRTPDVLHRRAETLFRVEVRFDDPRFMRDVETVGPERIERLQELLAQRLDHLREQAPQAEAPRAPRAGALNPLTLEAPRPGQDPMRSDVLGGGTALALGGGPPDDVPQDPLEQAMFADSRAIRPPRVRPEIAAQLDLPPLPVRPVDFDVPPPPGAPRLPAVATLPPVVQAEPTVVIDVPDAPAPDFRRLRQEIDESIEAKGYLPIDDYLMISLDIYREPGDSVGYFRLRFAPNEAGGKLRVMRKDVAFVLDCSRSMGRRTFRGAQDGLRDCLLALRPEDRFNVIGFKRGPDRFAQALVPATPQNIRAALDFVDGLEFSGGTDIYGSLVEVSQAGGGESHPFLVFLASDGRPTHGVTDSRRIINSLTHTLKRQSSIFSVGVGFQINEYLLDMLAQRNRGFSVIAGDTGETNLAMLDAFAAVSDPLLINVDIDVANLRDGDVHPKRVPDLYRAGRIELFGRFRDEQDLVIHFVGSFRDERHDAVIRLPLPEQAGNDASIAAGWARNKVYELVGQQMETGDDPALAAQIRHLSNTYRLNIPYLE